MLKPRAVRTLKQLGAELRRARRAAGLSQTELAALVSVRQATVSSLETGTADVKLSTVLDVLGALRLQLALEPRTPASVEDAF